MSRRFGIELEITGITQAKELWLSQFAPPATIEEWMKGSAERANLWNGTTLRTDSLQHHIEDMLAAGMVEAVE